jgi:L-amino acid N-acyltransferase YncA
MSNHLIWLRHARPEDSSFLMEMYNNPDIRKFGSNSCIISHHEHEIWFTERLHSAHSFIYIAFAGQDNTPFGYIRFEEKNAVAVLSVAVLPKRQNSGLGLRLITEGCRKLAQETAVFFIIANVRQDNARSLHVFEKAGFHETGIIHSQDKINIIELSLDIATIQSKQTMEVS